MYLKQIWDNEADYKQYYKRIFANLHDTFKISAPGSDPKSTQQTVTTDFPEDLKQFYNDNELDYKTFSVIQNQG